MNYFERGEYVCSLAERGLLPCGDAACEVCGMSLACGHFSKEVAPVHYDRDHATPGAHLRVFGYYDTAAHPNPYSYNWQSIAEFDALFAALSELASEEVAERLGWRSPW